MCIALLFTNSEISKADIENIKSYCSFIDSIYFDGIILFGYIIIQTFLIILKKKSFSWRSQQKPLLWLVILPLALNQVSRIL